MKGSLNALVIAVLLSISGCESNKKIKIDEDGSTVVKARTPQQDTLQSEKTEKISRTVSGLVNEINMGKDGYTAKVISPANKIIAITVSRVNLEDPKQYKETKVGEILSVTGDQWSLEGETQITARKIN